MHRAGRILLLFSLVIGPLWIGSYFGEWRWPLLICATFALCVLLTAPTTPIGKFSFRKFSFKKSPRRDALRRPRWNGWLAALLIWPALQGFWMWHNAWGEFSSMPWYIHFLDNQPEPSLPGAPDRAEAWDRLSYIIPCLGMVWVTRSLVIAMPNMLRTIATTISGRGWRWPYWDWSNAGPEPRGFFGRMIWSFLVGSSFLAPSAVRASRHAT